MKPGDARQKRCPFSRAISTLPTPNPVPQQGSIQVVMPTNGTTFNREWGDSVPQQCRCLADKCMAWRNVLGDTNDGHCGIAGFQAHGG